MEKWLKLFSRSLLELYENEICMCVCFFFFFAPLKLTENKSNEIYSLWYRSNYVFIHRNGSNQTDMLGQLSGSFWNILCLFFSRPNVALLCECECESVHWARFIGSIVRRTTRLNYADIHTFMSIQYTSGLRWCALSSCLCSTLITFYVLGDDDDDDIRSSYCCCFCLAIVRWFKAIQLDTIHRINCVISIDVLATMIKSSA